MYHPHHHIWLSNMDHIKTDYHKAKNHPKSNGAKNAKYKITRPNTTHRDSKQDRCHRHSGNSAQIKVEVGRTSGPHEGQQMDKKVYRMETKDGEKIQRTTSGEMERRHRKKRGHNLDEKRRRSAQMEGIVRGLRPAVDGRRLGKR